MARGRDVKWYDVAYAYALRDDYPGLGVEDYARLSRRSPERFGDIFAGKYDHLVEEHRRAVKVTGNGGTEPLFDMEGWGR